MIKHYKFFCTNCTFKKVIGGNKIDEFVQVKQSDINRGSPKLDSENKTVVPPSIKRKKVFKCPECGYVIRPTELKIENKNNETDRIDGS